MRRAAALVALLAILAVTSAAAAAPPERASLPDIENEVMCPICGTPLAVAESPQAERERAFIRSLIARGETKAQIKQELVREYGSSVLALPGDSGFDLAAYLVPLAVALAAVATIIVALRRWRRRGASRQDRVRDDAAQASAEALSTADAQRLAEDLARYDV